jgi:hypothetical protein
MTPGATIRYTTDGSAPTTASPIYSAPLSPTGATVISARAFAAGMADSSLATASFTVQASSTAGAKVSFLGIDTGTKGAWKGVMGSEAWSIPGDVQGGAPYVSIAGSGKNEWVWAWATSDSRGVQRVNTASSLAGCAYNTSFQYDVNFTDAKTHVLSVYGLDWDRANRSELIEVLDFDSKTVLHSYTLSSFTEGTYVKYALKGHVTIRVTAKAGPNAVLSAFFVDPSSTEL